MRLAATLAFASIVAAPAAAGTPMPARFVADVVWIDAKLQDGSTVTFSSDTGGGGNFLRAAYVAGKGWATNPPPAEYGSDLPPGSAILAAPIPFAADALPAVPPAPIFVFADPKKLAGWDNPTNGNLGQSWFAGHIWTWDYPRGRLTLEEADWSPPKGARVIPVGLKPSTPDAPAMQHPRITVRIAGEPVDVLLDSGATTYLSAEAQRIIGGPRLRACSMMSASRFDRWHRDHPQWRTIAKGQAGFDADMIEVPDVTVAGFQVGPVWFTRRPDAAFSEMMSSSTDKPVEGAVGGNAYRSLVMTVDYLHGRAAFAQPRPR